MIAVLDELGISAGQRVPTPPPTFMAAPDDRTEPADADKTNDPAMDELEQRLNNLRK